MALSLAAEFPAATEAQWRAAVDAVLKGKPFDRTLVGRTADGIAIQPLYPRAASAHALAGRAASLPWSIVQRVDQPDAGDANAQALDDLTMVPPASRSCAGVASATGAAMGSTWTVSLISAVCSRGPA